MDLIGLITLIGLDAPPAPLRSPFPPLLSLIIIYIHAPINPPTRLDETEARYRQKEAERKRRGQGEDDEELEEGGEFEDL